MLSSFKHSSKEVSYIYNSKKEESKGKSNHRIREDDLNSEYDEEDEMEKKIELKLGQQFPMKGGSMNKEDKKEDKSSLEC